MIRDIVDQLNSYLDYSFKDTLKGIVYPVLNKRQWIPGDRTGKGYDDCVPNDKKKSIVYWEDYGTTSILSTPRYNRYQTRVRLIVWLNFGLIEDLTYDDCVREIMNCIPKRIGNELFIFRAGQQPKTPAIFARYDYRDGKQYVAPPFDVAAFDFDIKYMSTYCPIKPTPTIEPFTGVVDFEGNQLIDNDQNTIIL